MGQLSLLSSSVSGIQCPWHTTSWSKVAVHIQALCLHYKQPRKKKRLAGMGAPVKGHGWDHWNTPHWMKSTLQSSPQSREVRGSPYLDFLPFWATPLHPNQCMPGPPKPILSSKFSSLEAHTVQSQLVRHYSSTTQNLTVLGPRRTPKSKVRFGAQGLGTNHPLV